MWRRVLYLLSLCACVLSARVASAGEPVRATVGEHGVVFPAGYHGLEYFSDEPPSFLGRNPFRFLVVAGNSTVLMLGQTLESAVPVGKALAPGPATAFDNGYTGITSVFYDRRTKRWLGFYHAEDHVGLPSVSYNKDIKGAYWSIGLAVSRDRGVTWQKAGQILRASVAKKELREDMQGVFGLGDVHVIPDATNTYLYAYYTDLTRRKEDFPAKIGMARCRIADGARPGSWFHYHDGEFKEKGLGGQQSPVVTAPRAFAGEVIHPHVTYLAPWHKYVMVCNVVANADCEKQKAEKGGIFLCSSEDGIKWSEPKVLVVGLPVPYRDREYVAHPSLFLEKTTPTTAEGWLLYCYSQRWGRSEDGRVPHHLARRPITITLAK